MVILMQEPVVNVSPSSQGIGVDISVEKEIDVSVSQNEISISVSQSGPQGPKGDKGEAGTSFEATNKSGSILAAGTVVSSHSSGVGVVAANATSDNAEAIGLITSSVAPMATTSVQVDGPIELDDWTPIVGTLSLSAKTAYFLSTTAGRLTDTPPSGSGNVVQKIGHSVGPQTLQISIEHAIIL